MFYSQCNECNQRWELGTGSTCACVKNEPIAWIWEKEDGYTSIETHSLDDEDMKNVGIKSIKPLYTAPPQRTWVGLTEAQCGVLWKTNMTPFEYYQAIEAKLKENNNG